MLKYCSGIRLSFVLAISSAYTGTEAHADASCFGFLFLFFSWNAFMVYSLIVSHLMEELDGKARH